MNCVSPKDALLLERRNTIFRIEILISNRMAYGTSTLEVWTFRRYQEDNKAAARSDFAPSTTEEMGNNPLNNIDVEVACRYPFTVDFTP